MALVVRLPNIRSQVLDAECRSELLDIHWWWSVFEWQKFNHVFQMRSQVEGIIGKSPLRNCSKSYVECHKVTLESHHCCSIGGLRDCNCNGNGMLQTWNIFRNGSKKGIVLHYNRSTRRFLDANQNNIRTLQLSRFQLKSLYKVTPARWIRQWWLITLSFKNDADNTHRLQLHHLPRKQNASTHEMAFAPSMSNTQTWRPRRLEPCHHFWQNTACLYRKWQTRRATMNFETCAWEASIGRQLLGPTR